MQIVQKNDFVEIEFTGKIKDTNEVFDTNSAEEIKKRKLNFQVKPYIVCIGKNMSIKGLDNDLDGKEVGKEYSADFQPEEAFGKRNPAMVRMIPLRVFINQKIMPEKGMQISLDGALAKVISVSSGRVLVDFNNPLAGKVVSYTYKIIRKLENDDDKINALQDYFFKQRFHFEIRNKQVYFKVAENLSKFVELMADPFGDILGMEIKAEIVEKK
jgi:FKBP-type peptidyl-prolyl cis-trans isomerase 2